MLRGLLKSPPFAFGAVLFLSTVLLALMGPLVMDVDIHSCFYAEALVAHEMVYAITLQTREKPVVSLGR